MNSDIYTINRTKNNNLLLLKVANSGLNDFAFDSINPNIAVCDVNYATAGGGSITVRRIYTTEETITEGFNEMTMEKIKLHGKELKLSDDLKIKAHDRHNLGVCPIVIFYNLPYTQERQAQTSKLISFGNTALNNFSYDFLKFNFQKDSAYCEDLATLINQAYITMYKKMIYCRPRVIYTGANAAEFYGNGGTNALKAQLQDSDFIINIENNAEQLQVINQDTKLTDIQESIDNL
jgi:hypothetical protein